MRETGYMVLVERDAPLAALRQCAQEAAHGEGRFVLVAGEAGIGKSVLLDECQREVADATWSWGACDGLSTPRPLAPLFDLAAELGGHLGELAHGRADRDELFRALLQQVLDGDGLQIIVIEDIHWADEASLDLLRFLARRIRSASVLLIATYRDDAATGGLPLRLALGDLATLRWARRVKLEPFSPDAVQALTADTRLDAGELFELTGGNPFYVTEMIEANTRGVPLSARDAVLARAARLTDDASRVLSSASLMGTRIEQRVLTEATQSSPEVLDQLIGSGLLVEEGSWFRFRHEIARRAVEHDVPAHRRAATHAAVLDALLSLGSTDDARLAFHAEGAGDDAAVLHHSLRAARRSAELGSHREAAAQYERALRFVTGADPQTVAELYTGLAEESSLGDAWQIAADADERALLLWRQRGDRREEGATLRRYSMALRSLCRGDEALQAAEDAVAILEPLGTTRELAAAYSTLASVRMSRNDNADAIELARRAAQVARQVGAVEVIADALNTEGCAISRTSATWMEPVRRALELSLSHNLQSDAGRAYNNLYGVLVDQFRFDDAERYFVDGIAYADEHDLGLYTYCLRATRTTVLRYLGRWDEALALGMQLLQESTTAPQTRICPNVHIGTIRARRGEPDSWQHLDQAVAAADPTNEPQYIVPTRLALAEAFWLDGKQDQARRDAERAADAAREIDPWLRGALGAWLRRTGSSRLVGDDVAEPYQLQRDGRHLAAARFWDDRGCQYDAALALLDSSDESALRAALQRFDELGATATAGLTRRKLRQLGVRSIPAGPRRATRSHPLGLTPRERQVLELVCARRTNADIAQELFISAKTVDHHVSSVLAKLNAGNREIAAATAFRLGLVATVGA